ncbi:MAG: IclR family transcriptional regulator [Desulfobacterota bacterium]|jgi:DNA-binding IclR family transcriptional regulator|nr:IclR family transcriptional regulator [Thermodesulfobacteriota bacterium]
MIIQSVDRALEILTLFSYAKPRWGITEIAAAMDLPKGTTHNIVSTLDSAGFLRKDEETRKYCLGPRLFSLGTIMGGTLEINQRALRPAHNLVERTGLMSRVAVWDHDAALLTLEVAPHNYSALAQRIGPRVAAYCSALGKSLLAWLTGSEIKAYMDRAQFTPFTPKTIASKEDLLEELERTRKRGYAINNEEIALGRASLAAPVFGRDQRIAGAISQAGDVDQILGSEKDSIVRSLQTTAAEISSAMGYYPAAPQPLKSLPKAPSKNSLKRRKGKRSTI